MIKKSVLLTALAIAGFAVTSLAQTVPNYVPTNGLVGWWPFNGNAIDESINTNDGTVNGATLTSDRFGNANSAYSFNGVNDYIQISNSSNFNLANGHSISIWFNPNGIQQSVIIEKFNNTNGLGDGGPQLVLRTNQLIDFSIYNNNSGNFLYSNTPSTSQSWQHIIATWNGNLIRLYQNSVLIDSIPFSSILNPCIEPMMIGKRAFQSDLHFNGKIDDIGIWNRSLTQQEITTLYNGNLCFQTITVTDTLLINTNITGFNPVTYQNTIKIWPNPTNDHITIDNGNLANLTGHQIKISNALGQQVFQSAITQQQFYVNMSTWGGNGIYFVNLINAQGVTIETRKIVLQ
jgi:hypothetical protein